ncbi:MAG: hypothetical protein AAFZ15_27240 [Bacteroidota bacterium]
MKTLFLHFFFFILCSSSFCQQFELGFSVHGGVSRLTGNITQDDFFTEGSTWEKSGSIGFFFNYKLRKDLWFNSGLFLDKFEGYRIESYHRENDVISFLSGSPEIVGSSIISDSRQRNFHGNYISFPIAVRYDLNKFSLHGGFRLMFHYFSYTKYELFSQFIVEALPGVNDGPEIVVVESSTSNVNSGIREKTKMNSAILMMNIGASVKISKQTELMFNVSRSAGKIFSSGGRLDLKLLQGTIGINYFVTKNY